MKIVMRILSYLKPYWLITAGVYASLFIALGLQLYIPRVIGQVIDEGIIAGNRVFLLRAAAVIIGLTALQGIFTFLRAYLVQNLAEKVAYDLRNEMYEHLQRLSFAFYDRTQTGQLMSRVTDDINNIRGMLMMTLRALVLAIAMLIAVTVIMLRTDWQLALVALATMPPLIWWSVRFGIRIRPLFLRVQQQFGVMTSALQENVAGARVVRAFAQEQRENARFEAELEELFERNMAASRRWSLSYPLTLLLSGLSIGAVLWFGGYRVLTGAITIGTLGAFNRYM